MPPVLWIALQLAACAGYFVTAKLGLSLAFVAEQVTPVWPPSGLAVALML
jgi:integral membrane sensor domain MASE1